MGVGQERVMGRGLRPGEWVPGLAWFCRGHNFSVIGAIAPKFQKTCLRYWRRLPPNFTPIDKVQAEKTVTEVQK